MLFGFILHLLAIGLISVTASLIFYFIFKPSLIKKSLLLTVAEAILTLVIIIGSPAWFLQKMHDPELNIYPNGASWFSLLILLIAATGWYTAKLKFHGNQPRNLRWRIIAGSLAIATIFLFLLGPLLFFRLANGIPMDEKGPEWEVYLLIAGGVLGSPAAFFIHDKVLRLSGRFTNDEIDAFWNGDDP